MGTPPPELVPHTPGMSPVLRGRIGGAKSSKLELVAPANVYIHIPIPKAQFVNVDAYANNPQHSKE
jgi:hypothetical protein